LGYDTQAAMFAFFGIWLLKVLLLRYGGIRAHRTALAFFNGLLAGNATGLLVRGMLFLGLGVKVWYWA
jgi:hypothetical protein